MDTLTPLRERFGARLLSDAERKSRYEIPERGAPGHAPAVLLSADEDELRLALDIANQHALHYVPRASRTGLVEAQRPQGEIALSLERQQGVLAFTLANGAQCVFARSDALDTVSDRRHQCGYEQALNSQAI